MGQFTILTRQLWDKDQNELRKVAVKTLQSKYSPQYLCVRTKIISLYFIHELLLVNSLNLFSENGRNY